MILGLDLLDSSPQEVMSRIAKWKLEKTKVKVVFRLQFHATHIPQAGWDKLFISFIPADSGKATAKTTKANVRNGTCKWADPIYETTRLLQDIRTKEYDEKLYKLVVAMGSSRSSLLGESTINLADYADALKPSTVALPLHGCDSGAMLHVTVQLLTSKTGFREFEQQRELRERGFQTTDQISPDQSSHGKLSFSEETLNNQKDKASSRVRFKEKAREHPSVEVEIGLNEECTESAVGFDGSSNTSESLYAEKHDTSSTHEIDSLKSTISGDLAGLSQSPRQLKGDTPDPSFLAQGTSDWVHSWGSDYSADNDLANAYEENSRLRGCLEVAESSINELKLEVNSLQSHADEIGAQAETISQQLVEEIASVEQLAKEVSLLKLECSKLKEDLEQQQVSRTGPYISSNGDTEKDLDRFFRDTELRWLKGLSIVEDKIRELRKKACLGYHERDFRFFNSDLDSVLGFLQDLKQGTGKPISFLNTVPSETINTKASREMGVHKPEEFASGMGFDVDLYQPELGMLHCPSIPGLVAHDPDSLDAAALKGKIFELLRELDESKVERESLAKKMDQMECYYEALIQELEENQRQMLGELQNLRNEHATCLYTISSTKVEMETMHQDLNEQILRFAEDKHNLDSLNKELERRTVAAEAALRRARLNYSVAVNHLQKDLELLSSQVLSMYETNENLIKQAFGDSSQSSIEGYPAVLQNQILDAQEFHSTKYLQCQNQNAGEKKQPLGGDTLLEDFKRSLHLQGGLYRKVEEELCEMHYVNMYLDVFSKTLQESLLGATADIRIMKERMNELTWQLELSNESKELLLQRLQTAMDEVYSLNEFKANCIAKCNDMALRNQTLETDLQNITNDNHLLVQKIAEWECLIMEYEKKYAACVLEKTDLANSLKKEALENGNLRAKIVSLQEELKTLETKFDEQAIRKENLQNIIDSQQNKLLILLSSYSKNFSGLSLQCKSIDSHLDATDLTGVVLQLEELQRIACRKISQLLEENKNLMSENAKAQLSLSTAESDILVTKQKFAQELKEIVNKLDSSNALVQKLQLDAEAISYRLHVSSEVEESYQQQHRELCSGFDHLEVEVQQLASKNEELFQDILELGTSIDELRRSKLTVAKLAEEKQALVASLQDKSEESSKLVSEIENLRGNLRSLHDELNTERSLTESRITDLTTRLNEKDLQLLNFGKLTSEVVHLKQLISDLKLEKLENCNLLLQYEEIFKNSRREASSISDLESQLSDMHELLIAADVRLIFTRNHSESCVEELVEKLGASDRYVTELQKKHHDIEDALDHSLTKEVQNMEEHARLLMTIGSLRSELQASIAENRALLDKNSAIIVQLEEYRNRAENTENGYAEDRGRYANEIKKLKNLLVASKEEIDNLLVSREELEVIVTVLKAKLDEHGSWTTLQERHKDELTVLQSHCNDLTQKLSEQILKTEEYKNLSIHLKELKDKADAESMLAREKRESEGPLSAMQESLRIAFIKEQYETKLQELKYQLCISKKHSEEMLLKLQDAIDEIENRKKYEAAHLKRNEELGLKILELEGEIQELISDKREKLKAYDMMKAELECSVISLECCKEEKQKLEASLQESNEEKSKISAELNLMKELVGGSKLPLNSPKQGEDQSDKEGCASNKSVHRNINQKKLIAATLTDEKASVYMVPNNGQAGNLNPEVLDQDGSLDCDESEYTHSLPSIHADHSNTIMNAQPQKYSSVASGISGNTSLAYLNEENLLQSEREHLASTNEQFGAQTLKSSLEHLNNELERMKNENLLLPQDVHQFDSKFPGLERELMQLQKVNEELGSIFPLFNEYSGSCNALERVLALEIELAESLRAKKSSIHFQSSFVKQHSNEEAIFQSFRDINDLINDMLELKVKYASVETELKEMHGRYSQLSLQFAEVEGERQKLMMTLKNFRASKKG